MKNNNRQTDGTMPKIFRESTYRLRDRIKQRTAKLTESLNAPYEYTLGDNFAYSYSYSFNTSSGDLVRVVFVDFSEYYGMDFISDEEIDRIELEQGYVFDNCWTVEFDRNGEQTITGEGDALRIFATVVSIIRDFLSTKKPDALLLESKERSRTTLYRRIIKRLTNDTPNYDTLLKDDPLMELANKLSNGSEVMGIGV